MKYLSYILLLFVSMGNIKAQTVEILNPAVDERVELLSIVFRLANAEEYGSQAFGDYVDAIDNHFSPFANHELIEFTKKIRAEHSLGYDAVMFMAVHISRPPALEPLVTFTDQVPEPRWNTETSSRFLMLLRKFYHDSSFGSFFKKNEALYKKTVENFKPVFDLLDFDWYEKFYGERPNGTFNTLIGAGAGVGNYGPKITYPNKIVDRFSIMGVSSVDSLGTPQFNIRRSFPVLVHEINHSFVNHLTAVLQENFHRSGEKIFKHVRKSMEEQAYGDGMTLINESIVRAAVLKYILDHDFGEQEYSNLLMYEINSGFLWMEELVNELVRYDQKRDKYPTLESYMPEIVKFFDKTASNIVRLKENIKNKRPQVLDMAPFKNNAENVDSKIQEIKVTFNKPLVGRGYSYIKGDKGDDAIPEVQKVTYSEDKKTVVFHVALLPNKEYQLILMGAAFKTEDGYGMEHYKINFSTK